MVDSVITGLLFWTQLRRMLHFEETRSCPTGSHLHLQLKHIDAAQASSGHRHAITKYPASASYHI